MKTMNMISRRSFLKAAMAASAVSALALTGCGGAASSTASTASGAAASSEAASSAVAGKNFLLGIVQYVDHAALTQILPPVERRADELGKAKGIDMPITDAAYKVLYEGADVKDAVQALLSRQRKSESEDAGWQ